MRICDRCGAQAIKTVLLDKREGTEYDLCASCKEAFDAFITEIHTKESTTEPKKRGRPRKEQLTNE